MESAADNPLETASNPKDCAHLLACSARESGDWLEALPISSLGIHMEDQTVRVTVGLRLGTSLRSPHSCHHCSLEVNALAMHGLNCPQRQGCHYRHASLNNVIHRLLSAANVSSHLEPSGLECTDGKPQMRSLSSLGGVGSMWFGTPPAETLLSPHTS